MSQGGQRGAGHRPTPRDFLEALVLAVLAATFVRTFLLQAFKVPSSSMEQSLLAGDLIVVNKLLYAHLRRPLGRGGERAPAWLPMREIRRGDVVVFGYPPAPERDFVKRCLAQPGETIEIYRGEVAVDGQRLDERSYLGAASSGSAYGPYEVPPGHYFVLGDRRESSNDSRSWGPLPAPLVRGRAWIVYWSFNESFHKDGEWSMIGRFPKSRWRRCFTWVR